ncbi:9362_t:CDS:1, partial [Acaulospora colombiana]
TELDEFHAWFNEDQYLRAQNGVIDSKNYCLVELEPVDPHQPLDEELLNAASWYLNSINPSPMEDVVQSAPNPLPFMHRDPLHQFILPPHLANPPHERWNDFLHKLQETTTGEQSSYSHDISSTPDIIRTSDQEDLTVDAIYAKLISLISDLPANDPVPIFNDNTQDTGGKGDASVLEAHSTDSLSLDVEMLDATLPLMMDQAFTTPSISNTTTIPLNFGDSAVCWSSGIQAPAISSFLDMMELDEPPITFGPQLIPLMLSTPDLVNTCPGPPLDLPNGMSDVNAKHPPLYIPRYYTPGIKTPRLRPFVNTTGRPRFVPPSATRRQASGDDSANEP